MAMHVNITLRSTAFDNVKLRRAVSSFVMRQARDFSSLTKRRMIESRPVGRLYRRGRGAAFTRAHRASARGQRPAIDTGKLLNSVVSRRVSEMSSESVVEASYAKYLQSPRLERKIIRKADLAEAQAKMTREVSGLIV